MFLIDDIVMAPVKGLFWIFEEIRDAAEKEQIKEAEAITAKLSELYMMLETGRITEAEFDAGEKKLLDRLDAIKEREDREEEDNEMVKLPKKSRKQSS